MSIDPDAELRQLLSDNDKFAHWFVWFLCWLGTALAGGIYGLISAGPLGFIAGLIFGAMFSIFTIPTIGILTWVFWLTRFSPIGAVVAGALTGLIASASNWDATFFALPYIPSVCLATFLGGIGAGLFAHRYWIAIVPSRYQAVWTSRTHWQFSIRELFLRFTVLTALIAVWTLIVAQNIK